jgi:mannose-6-phosphate isomerase-like protein (cupin superfamily)
VKIAGSLGTNVAALMAEGNNLDSVFIPAVEDINSAITESGHAVLPLAVEMKEKKMQPCLFSVSAKDLNDKPSSHLGEEYIFILEGSMDFQVGEITYTLGPKDSLFFNSIRNHNITKIHSSKVMYLNIFN